MSAIDARIHERLTRAGERILELFGHDENITGVGVGFRRRGGKVIDEPVVAVMVRKKRRSGLVSRRRLIPATIDVDGTLCPTDVVQAQAVLMNANGFPGALWEKYRALRFGCGVSNLHDVRPDAGTLGAFVRDNTDGTRGILSANHVLADNNSAPINDPVYQPAELDWRGTESAATTTIGRLKRFVRIAGGATAVDAAIAQVESTVRIEASFGGVELEPPSERRPAIGMLVAGDGFGNVWLTSMATTLRELNATLLPEVAGNVQSTVPSQGTRLEKVGRTTSFTVGRVHRTGETIRVEVPGVGLIEYTGLIKTQWMGWSGDSGAMVMRRANQTQPELFGELEPLERESQARIQALIGEVFETCAVLPAIQYSYEVPITEVEALSDRIRDEFMAQSETGRFLATLCYLNTTLIRTRLERRQTAEEQAYCNSLYRTYKPVIEGVMTGSGRTLNETDGQNYFELLSHLRTSGVLRAEEYEAAYNLGRTHERTVYGYERTQVTRYMDRWEVFTSVREATVSGMRSLAQQGRPIVLGAL
jgi:hypothetical protein